MSGIRHSHAILSSLLEHPGWREFTGKLVSRREECITGLLRGDIGWDGVVRLRASCDELDRTLRLVPELVSSLHEQMLAAGESPDDE